MDKVVYLLGAGFSAPLGLPLMNNFLPKAKDLFVGDQSRYQHFAKVFERIDKMHVAKSYYEADLTNIEEILSILEMRERVDGSDTEFFTHFLRDVITGYTPKTPKLNLSCANWYADPAGANWNPFFAFVMSLMRLKLTLATIDDYKHKKQRLHAEVTDKLQAEYGVISLNYDRTLEHMAECLNDVSLAGFGNPSQGINAVFTTDDNDELENTARVPLAKLHGCVSTEQIIAPTWNKGLGPAMVETWGKARELLATANQIRIIGYSLPITDAYIKYLLKSAAIESFNLKKIDVLCLDPSGRAANRYGEFITFNFFRFASKSTESYLGHIASRVTTAIQDSSASYHTLEDAHEEFFSAHGRA